MYDMPDGSVMKFKGPDGEEVVYATLKRNPDGSTEWVKNTDLDPAMMSRLDGMN